ncbi:hypothetical protein [Amycolatopsis coloradensis]|uniref:hypothetical protein n=1 Tax=Amycolatopsis coloradensis TaxID=76021 RepID=UPI001FCA293C|nr:hypothetical protein [Amycolatopsis coloradensis]
MEEVNRVAGELRAEIARQGDRSFDRVIEFEYLRRQSGHRADHRLASRDPGC